MGVTLPSFEDGKVYWLQGRTLNDIMLAIEERTALAGVGVTIDYLAAGQRIHVLPQQFYVPPVSHDSGEKSDATSRSGSGSKEGGGSGKSDSSSGSKNDGSGSKFAIVPVVLGDAVEWIGWQCVERPQAIFRDVVEVSLDPSTGQGSREIEREHVLSCEPGSLRITSVLAVDLPACLAHSLDQDGDRATIHLTTPRRSRRPTQARVTIEGVRGGHDGRWPRFTAEQALANLNFLRSAIGLPPLDSYPTAP